ncbi:Flp pilus assembly protein ATPase CpaE-like protein [Anaeromyxobacter dehalogenans 2CP-1]|uniref:Flp pilus assembly protein ATPase CpaE-like protein n=1 Tax=Anaeromyxobacter dehalogenans (strain ATCC BAA-258 / DSM 21875 / 2CP-1) TaxID=455488 RepID=B8JFG6_ANAD2|nr:AAA family ATPase [Anaeromyxobacter dehalogenans]ACL66343.1 Flp pilus assembly protein ATPase CpaE-like protein [Anaeromyxobacter dehalogenans 2CP-1]
MATGSILLVGVATATELKLRAAMPATGFVALPAGGRHAPEQLRGLADAAAVALSDDAEASFRLVRLLDAAGIRVTVIGPRKDADLILRAMREGAKEFVLAGDDETLKQVLRTQARPSRTAGVGTVYAVFPAKGGVGATTVATNLAGALQASGERTCLVDLNLNMGDVLAFLDLAGGYSIADVIGNMGRLDRGLLDATLLRHASGVQVLAQSHRIEDSDRVDAESVAQLLQFLRLHFGAIVLDGLRSFDDVSVAAVDASDRIVLLVEQEVPAVRDARRCVALFKRLGSEAKLKLVVNRYGKANDIGVDVIAETVGLPVAATIANDYPAVIRAVNKGVLVRDEAGRSAVARDIDDLLKVVGHVRAEPAAEPRERRSLFKKLLTLRTSDATE